MNSVDEVWEWYNAARATTQRLARVAGKHWEHIEGDNKLRSLDGAKVVADAKLAGSPLNDLAIVMMFSVFEATVRRLLAEQLKRELPSITHPLVLGAVRDRLETLKTRSFAEVLNSFSKGGHANLAEEVRQVRKYRNWITHGRSGKPVDNVDPQSARDRLTRFLVLVQSS